MDEVLAFLRPDETAAEFLARSYVASLPTGVPLIDGFVSLRAGNVLEVSGPHGSGKSEVLVQVRQPGSSWALPGLSWAAGLLGCSQQEQEPPAAVRAGERRPGSHRARGRRRALSS